MPGGLVEENGRVSGSGAGASPAPPLAGAVYRRSHDAVTREIADETLVVPIRGQLADVRRIFALNPVAALIWNHLDGAHDVEALCAIVAEAFTVEPEEAAASVGDFLAELERAGLAAAAAEAAPTSAPGEPDAISPPR